VYVEAAGTTSVATYDPGCNNAFDHVAFGQTATTVTLSIHGPASIGCLLPADFLETDADQLSHEAFGQWPVHREV
jgi:hypothetical protein